MVPALKQTLRASLRKAFLTEVRLVGSHLRGDRRPAHGQLGALTRALTLTARRLALVSI